jgi:hypothetical protein
MTYDSIRVSNSGAVYHYSNSNLMLGGLLKPSKIRVTLSRPLTWAEWERLTHGKGHWTVNRDQGTDFSVIHLEGQTNSRRPFEDFSKFLAEEFVNVFPKAVLTKQEMT